MSKWEMVKLGDCFTLSSGRFLPTKKRVDGEYSVFGGNGITGKHNEYFIDNPTIVIGRVGEYCGCVHTTDEKVWVTDNALYVTKFLKTINKNYICYCLNHKNLNSFANKSGQPSISQSSILKIEIPLPHIEIQIQIAKTIDTASELLTMRKQQLSELDNLIKSTFFDMFGDPVTNEKGWEVKALNDICTKITDGTHDTPKRVEKGVLFLTGKNIRPFLIDLSDIEYVSLEDHEIIYKRCNPQKGDILYTNIGVNYGTAARCTLDFEFSMKNVALLKIKKEFIKSIYLECALNYKRDYIINQNQTGGAQTFLGLATIKKLNILVPPLPLQTQFAEIVTKIEEQKALVQKAIDETQYLFDSLISQYFD